MKIGFIGAGNMAGAILRGMTAGGFSGNDLLVYDTDAGKLAALFEECGIRICDSGEESFPIHFPFTLISPLSQ